MVQTVVSHRRNLPAWDSRIGCPSRGSVPTASVNVVSVAVMRDRQKILRALLSCGWRRLMSRTAGEDIPAPPLKNQKTTELLRRTAMKFRPLHDRVVNKRIEAE